MTLVVDLLQNPEPSHTPRKVLLPKFQRDGDRMNDKEKEWYQEDWLKEDISLMYKKDRAKFNEVINQLVFNFSKELIICSKHMACFNFFQFVLKTDCTKR